VFTKTGSTHDAASASPCRSQPRTRPPFSAGT
jgi:hypothetical protein